MAELKGSKTEQNLLKAFAGESQARNRYTFFASVAKKEGLVQMSYIFEETANQEKEHAKRFFKYLQGGMVTVTETFPAGVISTTLENLKAAADGEHEEWTHAYPEFARIAREEGFDDIARTFEMVSVAEKQHEKRYRDLYNNLVAGKVFKKDGVVIWKCRNCGHIHVGTEAPQVCPVCAHPQAYFEVVSE